MKLILLLIPLFNFFSCSDKVDKNKQSLEIEKNNIILICNDKKTIYKDLIIDAMSVSTDFTEEGKNEFSLLYELNASTTKVKEKYNFSYSQKGIYLIYKEVIKYGKEGISGNRIYFNSFDMKDKDYEDLQTLGNQLPEVFVQNNPFINYFNFKNELFGKKKLNISNENIFIDYPDLPKSDIIISNVEVANNIAFSLQQKSVYNDSKLLLLNITTQYPDRIVAYLNLADADWALNNKKDAKENYNLYLSLMKKHNKDLNRVPKRVYERNH